ncbi:MAG: hypothetical protein ACKO39_11890, partial [Chthoniobacterales bacterium]
FRSALLQAALETGCEVTPAALHYEADPPGDTVNDICWWGGVGFVPHLRRFFALRSFSATVAFGSGRRAQGDRKAEAASLHTEVLALRESGAL